MRPGSLDRVPPCLRSRGHNLRRDETPGDDDCFLNGLLDGATPDQAFLGTGVSTDAPVLNSGRLDGRVAVVTGGTRGIGRAIAARLASEGADLAVSYVDHDPAAVEADVRAAGRQVLALPSDVSDAAACDDLVTRVVERFGRLDILVNNAAVTDAHRPWGALTEADWDRVMAVNAKGAFLAFRAAHPHLASSPSGRVVNISSATVHAGQVHLLHYVSSKAALIGFTRTLAREIGRDGITVNAVAPGAIRTESEIELFPDEAATLRSVLAIQSVERRGRHEDVAAAVAFLASDDSSFITGQTINVDGGWTMP